MWKTYLKTHLQRSQKQEPFAGFLKKHVKKQFEHMTQMERWTTMSLIENNQLVQLPSAAVDLEQFEEEFEDTIYECVCGSKKIDMYQKQLRGADEPMHSFFTCTQCGEKWTEN
jgi:DNA-directed RNA polymerase subunit M/transcription elongation factor TFIIS